MLFRSAIVTAAGLINACHLAGKKLSEIKLVVLGAGSAGIACLTLAKRLGVKNALLLDRTGVIYKGRKEGMNESKEPHAIETTDRTLEDALKGADAFYGLADKNAVTKEMVKSMAKNPIIFAMANPDPEITPAEVAEVRDDAIMATGRSDYPNQVNNVLGFPYIFRGALDVRAKTINEEMKVAAANALAELAREAVPVEVLAAYNRSDMEFGRNYIIPSAFDPRLITRIPVAVAKAAIETGVAKKKITDWDAYKAELAGRLNPAMNTLGLIYRKLKNKPKTVIFAEGEEEKTVRAAAQWNENGYGKAILIGREDKVLEQFKKLGIKQSEGIEIKNAHKNEIKDSYVDTMYKKLQRKGYLKRDCMREIKNDRNVFAALVLMQGEGDILITGLTRSYSDCLKTLMKLVGAKKGERVFGVTVAAGKNNQIAFISDTAVHVTPNAEQLAHIAKETADIAKKFGEKPRAAFVSYSNFGNPRTDKNKVIEDAIKILDKEKAGFEYDGDMTPDVALNAELQKLYPFNKLKGAANCLIMPSLEAANISGKILRELGGGTLIGPVLCGFEKAVQIVPMNCTVTEMLNIAAIASVEE